MSLSDYLRFVTDSDGSLRRYLFESNVRDYMGSNFVNNAILTTLAAQAAPTDEDFWWLNNGVTILATDAGLAGKDLKLENVQIVNGLQTTETVYRYFQEHPDGEDQRCLLVKVLVTNDKSLSDRIIRATNSQTEVEPASLRATDKIQRDIEDFLLKYGWYYDRRKNYYANVGKPANRIVPIMYLAWATLAVRLQEPHKCNLSRPQYMQDDAEYARIFNAGTDLAVYLAVVEFCKTVERLMTEAGLTARLYSTTAYVPVYRFLYATLAAVEHSHREHPADEDIVALPMHEIDVAYIRDLHARVQVSRGNLGDQRRLHRNEGFTAAVIKRSIEHMRRTQKT